MTATPDVSALPFDTEDMLAHLRVWIECESPSYDPIAVDRMMALAAGELGALGAIVERIPGVEGRGGNVRARLPHPQAGEGGILVVGHLDTVHPEQTLKKLPWKRENGRCYGPGIFDMKGGAFLAVEALRKIREAGWQTRLPVTVLFNGDEEIGSPTTRKLIEDEARRHRYVLVPEPARPDGGVVVGRYAIARFRLTATGTPSHAGSRLADGRSAIRVMAEKLIELENLTCEDYTFSVGVIQGGQWVNCVPTECTAQALTMAKTQAALDRAIAGAKALGFKADNAGFSVEQDLTRPVWEPSGDTMRLFEIARKQAEELGFAITPQKAGGGSDGNFTGAMGAVTLDGLGPRGAGLHTLNEHILEDSLAERARLIAGLFLKLE
jgi:glutamate carboxypeptidase